MAPIYIQTHQIREEGLCEHFNAKDGDELCINVKNDNKLSQVEKAIELKRPIFLIGSGSFKDYEESEHPNLEQLRECKDPTIYVLISRCVPYECKPTGDPEYKYEISAKKSRIFADPYVVLNSMNGFQDFRKSYIAGFGFINCERSPFSKQLLDICIKYRTQGF